MPRHLPKQRAFLFGILRYFSASTTTTGMNRWLPAFAALFFVANAFSQTATNTHVFTHNRATIITDPSKGENSYRAWGIFPKNETSVRRVKLLLTLGNPHPMPTAHWDYCDVISIRRLGGINATDRKIEIGRMLTPYGSIFGKGWQWQWEVDVSDFAPLLRDSVEIEYLHTGYEPNTVGWALTLDFEITYGPPVAKQLGMVPLWNDKFKYGDPANKIENSLKPVDYTAPAGTSFSRLRIQHTGHGADRPRNCSEFCKRWREIYVDDKLADRRDMWKECSTNPLYPQGGTWIYYRAYWCPGDLQAPDVLDVPTKPGKHTTRMVMEPYTATDNIQAYEHIGSYLFHYGKPQQANDACIDDIVAPTAKQMYFRKNPEIAQPAVLIRNLGSRALNSLEITYGTKGLPKKTFAWKGNLAFNNSELVLLPGPVEFPAFENGFEVSIAKPNGKADGWNGDNTISTNYNAPVMLPDTLLLRYKTNNRPQDNFITLINANWETLYRLTPGECNANTVYTNTVALKPGYYTMQLTDTAGNGLQFWAQPQQGDGYLRLYNTKGQLVHVFESDCGSGERLSFQASPYYRADTSRPQCAFTMFPRRTSDKIELEVEISKPAFVSVKITVDGMLQQLHEYTKIERGNFTYSLASLPKGRFVVDVYVDGKRRFTGRVNRD